MKTGTNLIIAGVTILALGSFISPLLIVMHIVQDSGTDHTQFKIPGQIRVTASAPGRYYLWNDNKTIYGGISYNRSESVPDGIKIRLSNPDTGEPYDFVSNTSMSVSSGSSEKHTIGYITIEKPCDINIDISGGNEERIFSFSRAVFMKIMGLILGVIALAMTAAITGIAMIVFGIIKTSERQKTL